MTAATITEAMPWPQREGRQHPGDGGIQTGTRRTQQVPDRSASGPQLGFAGPAAPAQSYAFPLLQNREAAPG